MAIVGLIRKKAHRKLSQDLRNVAMMPKVDFWQKTFGWSVGWLIGLNRREMVQAQGQVHFTYLRVMGKPRY